MARLAQTTVAALHTSVAGAAAVFAVVVTMVTASAASRQLKGPANIPEFEVATVRTNGSGDPRPARHSAVPASGRVTITNITVSQLIHDAYDVQLASLIVNMPGWARSQRVDVVAKAAAPAPVAVLQQMLQPLLAEHFKLVVRRETREMDALRLVVARSGRLGPQLRRATAACDDIVGTTSGFAVASESAGQGGPCGILPGGAGRIVARGLDMVGLADLLAPSQRRVVLDGTGLTGRFDVDLTYTPDAFSAASLAQRPGATLPPGVDPSGPPLSTALRDQLGLKLEAAKAQVEVLVIDRIEPLEGDQPR